MKNPFLSDLAISLITNYFALNTCLAQAPMGIPYQAIARNASGVAIANTAVKVRFSIRDSIATGAIKYQETHNPTTSALGLFSVNVGMGTIVSGTFSGINWGKNAKFLQVELNTTGGTTYTDLGTTQMMSVPYALVADKAGNCGFSNMQVFDQPGSFTWTAPADVRKVKVECWGGGAGGVDYSGNNDWDGSSGAYGCSIFQVDPNNNYQVVVGAGGQKYSSATISSIEQVTSAFGGTSSFSSFIYSTGGAYTFVGCCGSNIIPKGGTSNGVINIEGNIGTNRVISGSNFSYPANFGGYAPNGGAGGNLNGGNPDGSVPGGGGYAYGNGGHGRVIIWW